MPNEITTLLNYSLMILSNPLEQKYKEQWTYNLTAVLKLQTKHINKGYSYSCALASGHSKYHLCNMWRCWHKVRDCLSYFWKPMHTVKADNKEKPNSATWEVINQFTTWPQISSAHIDHATAPSLQHPFLYNGLINFVWHIIWPVTNYTNTPYLMQF